MIRIANNAEPAPMRNRVASFIAEAKPGRFLRKKVFQYASWQFIIFKQIGPWSAGIEHR